MKIETVRTFCGNNQPIKRNLPLLYILEEYNEVAIEHIRKNTGLRFEKVGVSCMQAQPTTSKQIVKLFLTYDFKTQYHDNATTHNTIYLKSINSEGFKIKTICFDCCKQNGINARGLNRKSRLLV